MNPDRNAEQRATWLVRLADASDVEAAARALREIDFAELRENKDASGGRESRSRRDLDADTQASFERSVARLEDQLPELIPRWIDRLIENLATRDKRNHETRAAIRAGKNLLKTSVGSAYAQFNLQHALRGAGSRIDPYLRPVIAAFDQYGRDGDEELARVLEFAGPAVVGAIPALLAYLKKHHVWHWPSHLAAALATAARHDPSVIQSLADLLSDPDPQTRRSAMEVLSTIGPAARSIAPRLLEFRDADAGERCGMIDALAASGAVEPEHLAVYEQALRDADGYVRRTAAYAAGKLKIDPARFVPLLVELLDDTEPLHDTSLPEAAVPALGKYGPEAAPAVERLWQFLRGPIAGRTVEPKLVRQALAQILGPEFAAQEESAAPPRRTTPLAEADPLFAVKYQGKQCYVDRQGRIAIRTDCANGDPFSCGRAVLYSDVRQRNHVVIDREGQVVFEVRWERLEPFSEGLAAVRKSGKWGFVDLEGKVVIEPQYDSVTAFSEGLAGIESGREDVPLSPRSAVTMTQTGLRGYIDRTGKVVIPPKFYDAQPFREGLAAFSDGGVLKPNPLFEGEVLTRQKKLFGYIDRTGAVVIPPTFPIAAAFSGGRAMVIAERHAFHLQYGYIDPSGKIVIPMTLTSATAFKEGVAIVRNRGRARRNMSVVIDATGRAISQIPLRDVSPFSEGLASAHMPDSQDYGYIDATGQWVIAPQFDDCSPFENGLAQVQRGKWYALIDRTGAFVWGPIAEGSVQRVGEQVWS